MFMVVAGVPVAAVSCATAFDRSGIVEFAKAFAIGVTADVIAIAMSSASVALRTRIARRGNESARGRPERRGRHRVLGRSAMRQPYESTLKLLPMVGQRWPN
jgi:hypothetical protein